MNIQKQYPYKKHPSLDNLFITDEGNNILKEFKASSEGQFGVLNSNVNLQQEYAIKHSNYVLGIKNIDEQKNLNQIKVTYDCDKSAIPLSKIKSIVPKHQMQIFKNLYQIYGFLNKENILHRNLKPNNIILYKNQLLLTDFSYKGGEYFTNKNNFQERVEYMTYRDNIHPYPSQEIADIINTKVNKQDDELSKRDKQSIKKQDQYAIAIMMLEVFLPQDKSLTPINKRQQQINSLNLPNEFSSEDVTFIKNIISELLVYTDFNPIEFENTLNTINQIDPQIANYKINKQDKMIQKNHELVKQCLENKDIKFDLTLLYYFSLEELKNKYRTIQNKNNENKEITEEIKRLLIFYSDIDYQRLDINESYLNQLENEDLFLLLIYLDEKIEQLQKNELSQQIIAYHNMKRLLKPYYQIINNLQLNQFRFNNAQKLEEQNNNNSNSSQVHDIISQKQNISQKKIESNFLDQIENSSQVINVEEQKKIYVEIINVSNINLEFIKKAIEQNFSNQILINQFLKINKQILYQQQIGCIFKHQDYPNIIYLGQINNNIFEGEVMLIEENNKMIKHFFNVYEESNCKGLYGKDKQSSIFYYQENNISEMFLKIKEYFGGIQNGEKNGKGQEKNFIENMSYEGQWQNDLLVGEGTKTIISTENIQQNTPYKWYGNFQNNRLNGEVVKTYLLNNNQEIWYEGRYQNNFKKGTHICYMRISNNNVQLYKVYFIKLYNQELSFKLCCN